MFALFTGYIAVKMEQANVGREVRYFNRISEVFVATIIVNTAISIFITEYSNIVSIVRLTLNNFIYIICNLFFGSYFYVRKKSNDNSSSEKKSQDILDLFENPINRCCLRLHMRELLQETQ